jgi:hypothetical protein
MLTFLEKLILNRYQVTLQVEKGGQLPGFVGSALRGAIGWGLWEQNCLEPEMRPFTCRQNCRCIVGRMWLPNVHFPDGYGRRYANPPKPFLVQTDFDTVPRIWKKGDLLTFNISIIGKVLGTEFFTHILPAIEQAVGTVGTQKLAFSIQKVERLTLDFKAASEQSNAVASDYLTMSIVTPLSIFERDALAEELRFGLIIKQLLERARNLSYLYCRAEWTDDDTLLAFAARAEHQVELFDQRLERLVINREGDKEPVEGWRGTVRFRGDYAAWLPLLQLAEWLNIGKLADMGFGRVRFDGQ